MQMICICSNWCHCHPIVSCSSKIQNGLPFWCRLTHVVLEKRLLNECLSSSSITINLSNEVINGHVIMCSDESAEMAKLYGNKSAALYQLALQAENEEPPDTEVKAEILQHALNDGLKSVELDASYEKGHFRLVLSTFYLSSAWLSVVCLITDHVLQSYWHLKLLVSLPEIPSENTCWKGFYLGTKVISQRASNIGVNSTGNVRDTSLAIFGQPGTKCLIISPKAKKACQNIYQIACRTDVYSATSVCGTSKTPI